MTVGLLSPYGLTWLLPFSGLTVTPLHRDLRGSVSLLVRTLKRQAQGSCGSKQHFALRLSKFNELKVIRLREVSIERFGTIDKIDSYECKEFKSSASVQFSASPKAGGQAGRPQAAPFQPPRGDRE